MSGLKVISTGHVIEVFSYEKEPFVPDPDQRNDKKEDSPIVQEIIDSGNKSIEENRKSNAIRTRNMIRRLCLANFNAGSKFITLTFAENVTDLDHARKEFDKFIKRLRRRFGSFKYIAVIEFQKRGAIHYHIIMDLTYIKKNEFASLWRNGFIKINRIKHVDNVGAYMVKYMSKDVADDRLNYRKSYSTSQNLFRPLEYRGKEAKRIVQYYNLNSKKEVFTNSYESEYLGQIVYKEYNLKRLDY